MNAFILRTLSLWLCPCILGLGPLAQAELTVAHSISVWALLPTWPWAMVFRPINYSLHPVAEAYPLDQALFIVVHSVSFWAPLPTCPWALGFRLINYSLHLVTRAYPLSPLILLPLHPILQQYTPLSLSFFFFFFCS